VFHADDFQIMAESDKQLLDKMKRWFKRKMAQKWRESLLIFMGNDSSFSTNMEKTRVVQCHFNLSWWKTLKIGSTFVVMELEQTSFSELLVWNVC